MEDLDDSKFSRFLTDNYEKMTRNYLYCLKLIFFISDRSYFQLIEHLTCKKKFRFDASVIFLWLFFVKINLSLIALSMAFVCGTNVIHGEGSNNWLSSPSRICTFILAQVYHIEIYMQLEESRITITNDAVYYIYFNCDWITILKVVVILSFIASVAIVWFQWVHLSDENDLEWRNPQINTLSVNMSADGINRSGPSNGSVHLHGCANRSRKLLLSA
jgi:hypothetical protein